jgi:hypothetical protein
MRFTRQIVVILGLILLAATSAFSQQLQSGALLTITSNDGLVNRAVYDSQIHSGQVQQSPCDADKVVTDAYVLQGGSPTGCDEGDLYETSQSFGTATISGNGYSFTVTTFYLCGISTVSNPNYPNPCTPPTALSTPPTFTPPVPYTVANGFCNTNGNICTSPDTGFMAVTLNAVPSGTTFNGTITLAGVAQNPNEQNPIYCPTAIGGVGPASDTFNSSIEGEVLALNQTWVFALAKDASNCGGFIQTQTQMLTAAGTPGATITFPFGPDEKEPGEVGPGFLPGSDYILTGLTNTGGETITFSLTPVLASNNPNGPGYLLFSPGGNFPNYTCDPYGDLSEVVGGEMPISNHVCAEVHLACSVGGDVGDCETFTFNLTTDYTQPSDVNGAGNAFLEDDGEQENDPGTCPSSSWDANIFLSVSVLQTKKKGGSNPSNACFTAANGTVNNQPAPLVQEGQSFVSFEGLEIPFVLQPPKINLWPADSKLSAPFSFDYIGSTLTNATFSPQLLPINCSTRALTGGSPIPITGTLYNLTALYPKLFPVENGLTEYLFDAVELPKGCYDVQFEFALGPQLIVPQQFLFF